MYRLAEKGGNQILLLHWRRFPLFPQEKRGARSSSIIRFNHRQRGTHLGDEQIKKVFNSNAMSSAANAVSSLGDLQTRGGRGAAASAAAASQQPSDGLTADDLERAVRRIQRIRAARRGESDNGSRYIGTGGGRRVVPVPRRRLFEGPTENQRRVGSSLLGNEDLDALLYADGPSSSSSSALRRRPHHAGRPLERDGAGLEEIGRRRLAKVREGIKRKTFFSDGEDSEEEEEFKGEDSHF